MPLNVIYQALRNSQNPAPRDGSTLLFYLVALQDESGASSLQSPYAFYQDLFKRAAPGHTIKIRILGGAEAQPCSGQQAMPVLSAVGWPSDPSTNLCYGDLGQALIDGVTDSTTFIP